MRCLHRPHRLAQSTLWLALVGAGCRLDKGKVASKLALTLRSDNSLRGGECLTRSAPIAACQIADEAKAVAKSGSVGDSGVTETARPKFWFCQRFAGRSETCRPLVPPFGGERARAVAAKRPDLHRLRQHRNGKDEFQRRKNRFYRVPSLSGPNDRHFSAAQTTGLAEEPCLKLEALCQGSFRVDAGKVVATPYSSKAG